LVQNGCSSAVISVHQRSGIFGSYPGTVPATTFPTDWWLSSDDCWLLKWKKLGEWFIRSVVCPSPIINHPTLSTSWFKTAVHQRLSASISRQGFLVPTGDSPRALLIRRQFNLLVTFPHVSPKNKKTCGYHNPIVQSSGGLQAYVLGITQYIRNQQKSSLEKQFLVARYCRHKEQHFSDDSRPKLLIERV